METFEVGELAFAVDTYDNSLVECEVISELHWDEKFEEPMHTILVPSCPNWDGTCDYECPPSYLRKRRPPPDWEALSQTNELEDA